MAFLEKETIQNHKVFFHEKGTQIFVYPKTFSGLDESIGQETYLCQITDVYFNTKNCNICGGTRINVSYEVKIIDCLDRNKINMIFDINENLVNASRYQSRANYHGRWYLDSNEELPLMLIKPVEKPDNHNIFESNDLLHVCYPGASESRILSKELIGEEAVHKLKVNLTSITKIDYGTIDIDDDGNKIKGYSFQFLDSELNFTVAC